MSEEMNFDDKMYEVRQIIEKAEATGNWKRAGRLKKGLSIAEALYPSSKIGAHRILNRLLGRIDMYGCVRADFLEASK